MRVVLKVAAAATLALALAGAGTTASRTPLDPLQSGSPIPASALREHLVAFQRIADRNGGTRAAATPGYEASVAYVAARMRKAGYAVRFHEFRFPLVADRTLPILRRVGAAGWRFRANRDYGTIAYSGTGRVEAGVVAVDLLVPSPRPNAATSGCEARDFDGFPRGSVALVQRGACSFRGKVTNAVAAGASAVVMFNEGNAGRRGPFAASLGPPQVRIPVLGATFAVGEALRRGVRSGATGVRVKVEADVVAETRRTRNVIAESRTGNARNLVVAGAHLDGVPAGPGMNDNASGSSALLEVAERLAETRSRNRLRFVWWGAEELGLFGSRRYVERLSPQDRRAHALYLNLDMVGSPNHVLFVYDGNGRAAPPGSAAIERQLTGYLRGTGIPFRETELGEASDHAPFAAAGIPVGGLFTGADGQKSQALATFGGRAGTPFDPCYHRACDTLANVNLTALSRSASATEHVLRRFARDVSAVRQR